VIKGRGPSPRRPYAPKGGPGDRVRGFGTGITLYRLDGTFDFSSVAVRMGVNDRGLVLAVFQDKRDDVWRTVILHDSGIVGYNISRLIDEFTEIVR
jgi:hypothetical protein